MRNTAVSRRANESARLLGAELRGHRVAGGMSLRQLARRIGLSGHGTLVDYEYGRRIPPEDIVVGYERELDVGDGRLRALRKKALAELAATEAAQLLVPEERTSPAAETEPPKPVRHRGPAILIGALLALLAAAGGLRLARARAAGGRY